MTERAYGGEERRSWQSEAAVLHGKLENIETLSRETHDLIIGHVAAEIETKAAIDELVILWRGSKMMVTAFKVIIPIVAAAFGAAMWAKDHFKW